MTYCFLLGFFCGRDQFCGTLFCSGGSEYPVTLKKSFYTLPNGEKCNEATMNPEDNFPADLPMVPTGTKCSNNMVRDMLISLLASLQRFPVTCLQIIFQVCYNQRCQDMRNLKAYGTDSCSAKCSNHGVRNSVTLQHFRVQYIHDSMI